MVGGGGKGPVLSIGTVGSIPYAPGAGVGGCRDTAGGSGGVYGVGGGGRVGKEGGREEYDEDLGISWELLGGVANDVDEVEDMDGAGAAPPSLSSL